MKKLVSGEGHYEKGIYNSQTREYSTWASMLNRCYSSKVHNRDITYQGCTVSENFKNFQLFAEWCNKQIGFGNDGWVLDKDILFKDNKIYSETSGVFVPQQINTLIIQRNCMRGDLPIGVTYYSPCCKYVASIHKYSKHHHLGYYSTPEEAFYAYKKEKELHIKLISNIWKEKIDPRVYNSLQNWVVSIDD